MAPTCARLKSDAFTLAVNSLDLASLLCSRLCHDLMSPVGALNNGIELLADETDPDMREKCLELLGDSARATANKLKFFRLAFGAGGARRTVWRRGQDRARLGGREREIAQGRGPAAAQPRAARRRRAGSRRAA